MDIISLSTLSEADMRAIWALVDAPAKPSGLRVAWSFEGAGIRTRTSFMQAFQALGMHCTELPQLLKTAERVADLAGYLDPFYDLYVIRESDHARLQAFADASTRPVVNAMSAAEHPCEVLTDAYYLDARFNGLQQARICLWGPTTNVFRSWHALALVLGMQLTQVCEEQHHGQHPAVSFTSTVPPVADVVITDAWPSGVDHAALALAEQHLAAMGFPALLPTPPFTVGRELLVDPATYAGFVGYSQKQLLLPVQQAILRSVTAT